MLFREVVRKLGVVDDVLEDVDPDRFGQLLGGHFAPGRALLGKAGLVGSREGLEEHGSDGTRAAGHDGGWTNDELRRAADIRTLFCFKTGNLALSRISVLFEVGFTEPRF